MSRLPSVGGDDDSWGNILNDFLMVSHNADGTEKKDLTDYLGKPLNPIPAWGAPGFIYPSATADEKGWWSRTFSSSGVDDTLGFGSVGDTYVESHVTASQAYHFIQQDSGWIQLIADTGDGTAIQAQAATGQTDPLLELRDESGMTFVKVLPGFGWSAVNGTDAEADFYAFPGGTELDLFANVADQSHSGKVNLFSTTDTTGLMMRASPGQTNPLLELKDENETSTIRGYASSQGSQPGITFVSSHDGDDGSDLYVASFGNPGPGFSYVNAYAYDNGGDYFGELDIYASGNKVELQGSKHGSLLRMHDHTGTIVHTLQGGINGDEVAKVGFFGATPTAKVAHPTTLADVITALQAYGLVA